MIKRILSDRDKKEIYENQEDPNICISEKLSSVTLPKVIAEVGCNHCGDMETAKKLIEEAALCGAWGVKFQKRDNDLLFPESERNKPHPVQENSYGKTYYEHRKNLEFSIEQQKELRDYAHENDIKYGCSVWDENSAKQICSINPSFIKVGSPSNLNLAIYKEILRGYQWQVHISFGMTNNTSKINIIREIGKIAKENNFQNNIVLYHCVSDYPVNFENINMIAGIEVLNYLRKTLLQNAKLGFSGHHKGIAVDVLSCLMGVKFIERHFTLDRTQKGTDHAASLEPQGLSKLVRDLKACYSALQFDETSYNGVAECEDSNYWKLKKPVDIKNGINQSEQPIDMDEIIHLTNNNPDKAILLNKKKD